MTALRSFGAYAAKYMDKASQLATYRIAREWMQAGVPAQEAAEWANLGFLPADAAPLIAAGVTPQMAGDLDDLAGSPEERAMRFIDRLVADGTLVDPARVRQEQDPDDSHHKIIHVDPE